MKKRQLAAILALVIILPIVASIVILNQTSGSSLPLHYTYAILNTYPHDTGAFTEGLVFQDGYLFESTGLNSTLRRVDLETGKVLQLYSLSDQFFGEGITIFGNEIIQLTWQSHTGFVYDKTNFTLLREFSYPTEGWGLTNDGSHLIMSDGTSNLYFMDPHTFERTGQVNVRDGSNSIAYLNELEYINGDVYANVFGTNKIVIINPSTGQVKAWIDLTGIPDSQNSNPENVLNGIAFDQKNNRVFITGKDWPHLYQIELILTK